MNAGDLIAGLRTEYHFGCAYYLSMFSKCYELTRDGWIMYRTPDNSSIADSDAFLMTAFDIIRDVKNTMLVEAQKAADG